MQLSNSVILPPAHAMGSKLSVLHNNNFARNNLASFQTIALSKGGEGRAKEKGKKDLPLLQICLKVPAVHQSHSPRRVLRSRSISQAL